MKKVIYFFLLVHIAKAQDIKTFDYDFSKSAKTIIQKSFTRERLKGVDSLIIGDRTLYQYGVKTYTQNIKSDTTYVKMEYDTWNPKEYIINVFKDSILIQSFSGSGNLLPNVEVYNFQDKLLLNYTSFSQEQTMPRECKEYFYNKKNKLLRIIESYQNGSKIDSVKRFYYYNKLGLVLETREVKEGDTWIKFYYVTNKYSEDKKYRYESEFSYDKTDKKLYKRYQKKYLVKNNIVIEESDFFKSNKPYEIVKYDIKGRVKSHDFQRSSYRMKREFTYLNNSNDYTLFKLDGKQTEFVKKKNITHDNVQIEQWISCDENFQNCNSVNQIKRTIFNEKKDWIRKEKYSGDHIVELQTREIVY